MGVTSVAAQVCFEHAETVLKDQKSHSAILKSSGFYVGKCKLITTFCEIPHSNRCITNMRK